MIGRYGAEALPQRWRSSYRNNELNNMGIHTAPANMAAAAVSSDWPSGLAPLQAHIIGRYSMLQRSLLSMDCQTGPAHGREHLTVPATELGYELYQHVPRAYRLCAAGQLASLSICRGRYAFYYFAPRRLVVERDCSASFEKDFGHEKGQGFTTQHSPDTAAANSYPPYRDAFRLATPPFAYMFNKRNSEWGSPPVNTWRAEEVRQACERLAPTGRTRDGTPSCHERVLYFRSRNSAAMGTGARQWGDDDLDAARDAGGIIVGDWLDAAADRLASAGEQPRAAVLVELTNVAQLVLLSSSALAVGVQGGMAVLSGLVGGRLLLLCKRGMECENDYTWYPSIANASMAISRSAADALALATWHCASAPTAINAHEARPGNEAPTALDALHTRHGGGRRVGRAVLPTPAGRRRQRQGALRVLGGRECHAAALPAHSDRRRRRELWPTRPRLRHRLRRRVPRLHDVETGRRGSREAARVAHDARPPLPADAAHRPPEDPPDPPRPLPRLRPSPLQQPSERRRPAPPASAHRRGSSRPLGARRQQSRDQQQQQPPAARAASGSSPSRCHARPLAPVLCEPLAHAHAYGHLRAGAAQLWRRAPQRVLPPPLRALVRVPAIAALEDVHCRVRLACRSCSRVCSSSRLVVASKPWRSVNLSAGQGSGGQTVSGITGVDS